MRYNLFEKRSLLEHTVELLVRLDYWFMVGEHKVAATRQGDKIWWFGPTGDEW